MQKTKTTRVTSCWRAAALLVLGLMLAPTAWAQVLPPEAPATAAVEQEAEPDATYRLQPGDGLEVRFFYNPELNEQAQVRPDGYLGFQLIGDLRVAGLTVPELTELLTQRYREDVKVTNPALTIQVRSYANRRVYVGGEVVRPSMLPLMGTQTVLGAIAEAGGLKASAKRNEVVVVRRDPQGVPQLIRLGLKARKGAAPEAAAFELQPLDVVLVTESGISRANRAVDQYVRQMVPFLVTAGFSYILNGSVLGVQ